MVEHVGCDIRQSLLTLQYWMRGSTEPFKYLSWLGLGGITQRWSDSLTSLLLHSSTERVAQSEYQYTIALSDRLQLTSFLNVSSLLHCNLFSFFPRTGTTEAPNSLSQVMLEAPQFTFCDSGICTTALPTTTGSLHSAQLNPPTTTEVDLKEKSMVPAMNGIDYLCALLSSNDTVKVEQRKLKLLHGGMSMTPDIALGTVLVHPCLY